MTYTRTPEVRGVIVLPSADLPRRASRVVTRLENVSRADARSIKIAEQVQEDVPLSAGGEIEFAIALPGELESSTARYTVRAHIDVNGTGRVECGDFVTTAATPVCGDAVGLRLEVVKVG